MKAFKALLLVVCLGIALTVCGKDKKPVQQSVYMFGVSMSFTDSVAYVTDLMKVDSVYLTSKGFLVDRLLYSLQLEGYLSEVMGVPQTTNAVIFGKNLKTVTKRYNRVKDLYAKNRDLILRFLKPEEFTFKPEAYIDPEAAIVEEETTAEDASTPNQK
ncbi:MAG: hypothetical protein MJZ35_02420 [Bacteroidaceae bacterium]|nr:hypothetical protein [Bacteroidaceae bacterium]